MPLSSKRTDSGSALDPALAPSALATALARAVAVALVAMPLTLLFVGGRQLIRYSALSRLSIVRGTILTSGVERVTDPGQRVGEPPTHTFRPIVTYSFTVQRKDLKGSRVTWLNESSSAEWATAVAARYVPGAAVHVHYDPTGNEEPFLERGAAPYVSWVLVVMGALPLLAWATSAARERRRSGRSRGGKNAPAS